MKSFVAFVLLSSVAYCDGGAWERFMERGQSLRDEGRYFAAGRAYEAALQSSETSLHKTVTFVAFGKLRQLEGNEKEAERLWRATLQTPEAQLPSLRAAILLHLANLRISQRRYKDAEAFLLDCETAGDRAGRPTVLLLLADVYVKQSKHAKAAPLLEEAMDTLDRAGNRGIDFAVVSHSLAEVYSKLGQVEQADILYARSLAAGEAALGSDSPRLAEPLLSYAKHLRRTRRKAQAKDLETRARSLSNLSAIDVNTLRQSEKGRF